MHNIFCLGNKLYVIDPEHFSEDKILREKLQLDKLVFTYFKISFFLKKKDFN